MKYDPGKYHRRSIRLRGYDYASAGAYFVTICVQRRLCRFGTVVDGVLMRNDAGRMVQATWETLPERFPTLAPDIAVVMPNHVHAIIAPADQPAQSARLGDIVGALKSLTTNAYILGVREYGWVPFDQRLWQRNYYEHVIRGEADLARIRNYIETNPARWDTDRLRPTAGPNRDSLE
jgi:REP element-mobilizing transposase RayT